VVQVYLAHLSFIDRGGVREPIMTASEAWDDCGRPEADRQVGDPVRPVIEAAGPLGRSGRAAIRRRRPWQSAGLWSHKRFETCAQPESAGTAVHQISVLTAIAAFGWLLRDAPATLADPGR
jgi:hypothetical protein